MSGKHFALYATVNRKGRWSEHRLAGARFGPVGVTLEFHLPMGWEVTVHAGRAFVTFHLKLRDSDPRLRDYFDVIMPPIAREALTQGRDDIAAGRGYRWDPKGDGRDRPLATWRPDDPEQPDGWHHDGTHWVLNDTGWSQDRGGFWRYNHPGDPGWTENPDGSWRYVKAG